MVTTSLPAPSLILRQQFARQIATTNQPLNPFIFGPASHLVRYDELTERGNGFLGTYDPAGTLIDGFNQTAYAWPDKPVGSSIDANYVRLFCKDAFLVYHQDDLHTAVFKSRNSFRSPTAIFKTNTFGSHNIGGSGVAIGDRVQLTAIDQALDAFTLNSYVIGLTGDPIAATVSDGVAAVSNISPSTLATSTTPAGTNSGSITATAIGTAYSGLAARRPSETYTVTVILGGAAGVARVQVVSASGTDDVASTLITALASNISIGTRGLTMSFAEGSSTTFTVGDRWVVSVTQDYTLATLAGSGTYTGTKNRVYIVEMVSGGLLAGGLQARVTSQDGTDTVPPVPVTLDAGSDSVAFPIGSFGVTGVFTASTGLMAGDKWLVTATAAGEGIVHTIVLAHDIPANVLLDDAVVDLEYNIYSVEDVEIPVRAAVAPNLQYVAEESQILVRASATALSTKQMTGGQPANLSIHAPAGFGAISQLYVTYRAWLAPSSGVLSIGPNDDLDLLIPGQTHPDNPLKYGVSLARGTAGGETVMFYGVGNPAVVDNWVTAMTASQGLRSAYGHVPLTLDQNVLDQAFSHVSSMNGETSNFYRVLWTGSNHLTGGPVLTDANSSDNSSVLATIEDDPTASGTQFTLVRLQGVNGNFIEAGVRPGDEVRYNFEVDGWGDATYQTRIVDRVLSATQLVVTSPFPDAEAVPKRVELHRIYNAVDLADAYSNEATARASDLVRFVLAPRVGIGSYSLPSYYACALLAGMRASEPAQRSLSRLAVPGISHIWGMSALGTSQLNRLAADGAMIITDDPQLNTVIVRHGVTTGETEILALREESMVSARHANLFAIVDRLKPYVAQINLAASTMEDLSDLIRAELDSVKRGLQALNASPELGGQLVDLAITFIGEAAGSQDTLKVIMSMELGRPGNFIDASVLIF